MSDIGIDPGMTGRETTATEEAKAQAQQVADRAHHVADDAQVKVREQIDMRATQAGEQVTATALALRSGADELYRQGNDSAGDAAHRAAAQAERLGSYLQGSDADQLLADAEDFARRNPWAVVIGGVVAGAAAARFLKASSSRRYESSRDEFRPRAATNGSGQ
jgi:hypothetical protein